MTLGVSWDEFRAVAIPPTAPEQQVRLMRIAFMAGASSALLEITRLPDGTKEPSLRIARHNISALQRELQGWALEARFG